MRAIPGFKLTLDFLSSADELTLLRFIRRRELPQVPMRGKFLRRRMLCFGVDFGPNFLSLRAAPPLPPLLRNLSQSCAELAGVEPARLGQAIVQLFPPGAGLGWHKDAEALGPVVIGVSISSSATLCFRREPTRSAGASRAVVLPPRSAYVMTGEARQRWLHSLQPVREERISITFRAPEAGTLRAEKLLRNSAPAA